MPRLFIIALALAAGPPAANAGPAEKHPCVVAGDHCVAGGYYPVACRASEKSCLAMSALNAQVQPRDRPPTGQKGPFKQPETPPLAPGDENPGDPLHPVAEVCETQARELLVVRLHGEIGRVLITKSPRWSVIWRADVSTPLEGGGSYAQRVVCVEGAFVLSPTKVAGHEVAPLPGN